MNPRDMALPPQSIEAEQNIIGAILLAGGRALDSIEGMVDGADFYRDDHRRIFTAAKAINDAGKPVDLLTVFAALEARHEAEQAGGLAYLGEIASECVSAANVRRYAEIVRERAILRGLQAIASVLQSDCTNPRGRPPETLAAEAEGAMLKLLDRSDADPVRLQDALGEVLQDVEARRERGGKMTGLTTGFHQFDAMTGGLEPGNLAIIAARPSVGKTIMGCNVADFAARRGVTVLFFTLEMSRREIAARILAARSRVSVQAMRSGTNDQDEWGRMTDATAAAAKWPLFIDDKPAVNVAYVRAKARRIQRAHGLGLVVVDYLQLMTAPGISNRVQEVGSISRGLKALAKELRVPVIALAQLSRANESRQDRRPILADLRDSGEIEQDADVVAMLHREAMSGNAPEWVGLGELLIRKNRNGPTGETLLTFDGPLMRFADYAGPRPVATVEPSAGYRRKGMA